MSAYETFFDTHKGRHVDKWRHYFPIYDRHFAQFRNRGPRVLEIGVDHGGSLELWRDYFGLGAEIVGLDNRQECFFEANHISVVIGDQRDESMLKSLGTFDIVIDDGSHVVADQELSFRSLWPNTHGVYLIEDCHVAYPSIWENSAVLYYYPWVVVRERPQRAIRGNASRDLRPDEIEARKLYGPYGSLEPF